MFFFSGQVVDPSECDVTQKPNETRACRTSCPRDCLLSDWSEWTDCDVTCGDAHKHRFRRILQQAQNGGERCPAANDDGKISHNAYKTQLTYDIFARFRRSMHIGVIFQSRECRRSNTCENYFWNVTSWSQCDDSAGCGRSVQRRRVYCTRHDAFEVDPSWKIPIFIMRKPRTCVQFIYTVTMF